MGAPLKVTDARLRATLRKHDGMQSLTAKALGVTRQCVHDRIQNSPGLQQFIADLNAQIEDTCEGNIFKKIKAKDGTTLRWFAERRLRDRGYGPKPEDIPPPPPDNSKRALIVNVLVQNLNEKAQRVHVQLEEGHQGALSAPAAKTLNGHAKPNGKANGHG